MSNGERQAEVESYEHLVALVYRIVLLFFNPTQPQSMRVDTLYDWSRVKRYGKAYSCKEVEGVCESM